MYKYIADFTTYYEAISKLNKLYIKANNEIFALHKLATRKQNPAESIDEFLQSLHNLAKDCNFFLKWLMQKAIVKNQLQMLLYQAFICFFIKFKQTMTS